MMTISPGLLNLLFIIFLSLSASIFFLYRIIEQKYDYASAERIRIVQVFLFLFFFLAHGSLLMGVTNMLIFLLVSTALSLLLEILGTNTGWLTSPYKYTNKSCPLPAVMGVPLCYPIVWCALIYISLWLAVLWYHNPLHTSLTLGLPVILVTPLLVLLLDLFLDPIAVDEGRWVWQKNGRYYGVPFSNFISWLVAGSIIMITFNWLAPVEFNLSPATRWFNFSPAILYGLLALASTRVCLERKLYVPAIVAIAAATITTALVLIRLI